MASLLDRKLIVVTGKGGAGKTTIAAALGVLGAREGRRTIVAEIGEQSHLPALLARGADLGRAVEPGGEIEVERDLWSVSLDRDRALAEWLRRLGGRVSARVLASSSTFQYFAAAAPGAKELVTLVKVRELCEAGTGAYDLVVLDAPASGHALAMLASPRTLSAIVRSGPLAEQADRVRELLEDPRRSGYVAVARASDMAVTETLELEQELRRELDRDLDAVIVNATLPRRFTREELSRIAAAALPGADEQRRGRFGERAGLVRSAARAASAVSQRARVQQSQLARLRRQRFADVMPPSVVSVPFAFAPSIERDVLDAIATRLAGTI
jgi:anion-transporting  ArsA/GET3 family ATPase